MGAILSNVGDCIGYVWGMMGNELLPGITCRTIFIWTWIALILVEFVGRIIFAEMYD